MTFTRARRNVIATVCVAAVLAMAGSAYAYWRTTGSGSGSSAAGTITFQVQALVGTDTTNAQGAQASTLIPGSSARAILRVKNPNSQTVHVMAITAGAAVTTGGCPAAKVLFTNPTSFTASQYTIAGGASVLLTLPSAVSLDATADQSCMGSTFSFPVTVTVQT